MPKFLNRARFLNRIYVKYIRPADPGFFIARYACKAAFSCLAAFLAALLFGLEGEYLFWWMVGAVCTVLFRTGSTLGRRKMYALVLLTTAALIVPVAALAGGHDYWGLGYIFLLSFFCFFVSSLGVSASTLGTGCLVVSLISLFTPTDLSYGLLRSGSLVCGGSISFWVNFYLWPFDPEKVLLSSARIAVEDMGFFFEGLCVRINNFNVSDGELAQLSREAVESVRRYRIFMESFNIDPLKGSKTAGGPGIFYFSLIRLFESIVSLFNHIHFADGRSEFDAVRKSFHKTAADVANGFDAFPGIAAGGAYDAPDFDGIAASIGDIQTALLSMGGYKQGDDVQDKFMDAWGAVYELKNVAQRLKKVIILADERFGVGAV